MYHRTFSQIINWYVLPEVDKRIKDGRILADQLPLELNAVRAIQRRIAEDAIEPVTELNEEVELLFEVNMRDGRVRQVGEMLAVNDVIPESLRLRNPEYDGKPAAYFLAVRSLFEFTIGFDFTPNYPEAFSTVENATKMRFPILDLFNKSRLYKKIRPLEKLTTIMSANWPPSPGFTHSIVLKLYNGTVDVNSDEFTRLVLSTFNDEYWTSRLPFWRENIFNEDRLKYISHAIDAHNRGDYISAIYVLVPQFEGLIKDHLRLMNCSPKEKYAACVDQLQQEMLSRKVLLYPRTILDQIFCFIRDGSFLRNTGNIFDPKSEVNRHGIVHGVFTGFECPEISLKYLLLLDCLVLLILQDRVITQRV